MLVDGGDAAEAETLAARLGLRCTDDPAEAEAAGLALRLGENGLSLVGGGQSLRADFSHLLARIRPGNLADELLVRAAKIKNADHPLTAVDATAGFGEDSFLLAAAGFDVTMYEYNPVIAALLGDALRRAALLPELKEIAARMHLRQADSIAALRQTTIPPDVVLLDPMFPARQKSALVKKKFQLLHRLESPCADESALLEAAMAVHPRRIVIKRPPKGPCLGGVKPTFSLTGKAVRIDCIVSVSPVL